MCFYSFSDSSNLCVSIRFFLVGFLWPPRLDSGRQETEENRGKVDLFPGVNEKNTIRNNKKQDQSLLTAHQVHLYEEDESIKEHLVSLRIALSMHCKLKMRAHFLFLLWKDSCV